ncbi:MAG: sigma factor [Leptospiraceae bacterium]|nr:sigma factor [Leptospiraceae bacterium]MCZ8346981.1 sigma factor [Leptospiraceae bacterium]
MKIASPKDKNLTQEFEKILRKDWGRLMAALTKQLNSLQLAEDALQEACIAAFDKWSQIGLPESPQGWLLRVAHRKALNMIRSEIRSAQREKSSFSFRDIFAKENSEDIPDERLRLIFTCCHPALDIKSRVALTLRVVCGISTFDIAKLFLDSESTMGQRLSRAKSKITKARIPFSIPDPSQWYDRMQAVLTTIYLVFTSGYINKMDSFEPSPSSGSFNTDLCTEAIFLTNILLNLSPNDPEVEGALALMLLTDSRRKARMNHRGETVPPSEQNRNLWDKHKLERGKEILEIALKRKKIGPFQIKAAISACQMADPLPDWQQILELYTILYTMEPTSIIRLNQAVALSESGRAIYARKILCELEQELKNYQPFYAAKASILSHLEEWEQSILAYQKAIDLASCQSDRLYLLNQLKFIETKK